MPVGETSTKDAPWFVVPADDKPNARLIVSKVILDRMERMKLAYPVVGSARKAELKKIRAQLE